VSRATATLLATLDDLDPDGRIAGDEVLLDPGQPANDEVATEHRGELALVAPGENADDPTTVEMTTWIDAVALALAAGLRVGATGLDRVATGKLSPALSTVVGVGTNHAIAPGATDAVLSVDDVAALLKVGRNAIYESVARDEIPHRRIGKQIRFSRAAIMAWLSSWSSRDAKERQ